MRYLLLPLCLLLAGATQAQTAPSLTLADMPVVGDSLRLSAAATALPASAPPLTRNGANQTWNYAGLVATSQRVERYNAVSSAAGAFLQFTFNNALISPDTRATLVSPRTVPIPAGAGVTVTDPLEFSNASAADFRSVGFGGTINGTALPVTYVSKAKQDIIYRFPVAYGNAADVSNSVLTSPVLLAAQGYFSQTRQRSNLPDAWGTLTTPFGTYQALRVVTTLRDHDSIALGATPGQGLDLPVRREYKWLAKGVHVPLLTITTAEVAGQQAIASIEYRDIFRRFVPLATQGAATAAADVSIYPSPSAVGTSLRLAVPAGSGPLTVAATDVLGRQVFSCSFAGSASGVLTLEAATLGTYRGMLLLTVTTAQGTATRRVVRE